MTGTIITGASSLVLMAMLTPVVSALADATEDYVRTLENGGPVPENHNEVPRSSHEFRRFSGRRRVSKMDRVTARHFDLFRESRRAERHLKTVYTERVILKQFFKWARIRKLIVEDPFADLRLYKPRREPKSASSLVYVDAVLAVAEPPIRD